MSVSVEQKSAVARRLTITIPGESVETEVSARLKQYGKNAKIKGFRPGKAPASIVRREYGGAIRADVLNEMMSSHYREAVQSEGLEPVGVPSFDLGEPGVDGSFVFTAELEVYPETEPVGLDRLSLKRPRVEIGDGDVDIVLERLRRQKQKWVAVDRPVAEGERVIVTFDGTIEGEAFAGGHGENVAVTIGANEMIPGFETGLAGISAGESRELELVFPADYRVAELAGKAAHFKAAATEVQAAEIPPLDDEFAAAFGCAEGGMASLRERVRENMEAELAARVREDSQRQLSDQLLEANPIEVPRTLVDREVEREQRRFLQRLGIKTEGTRVPELPREPYLETAERRIRLGLLMSALIKREAFRPDPARVDKHIETLCAEMDDPVAGARVLRADSEAMRGVEAIVLEDMCYDWLIEQANVSEEAKEFLAYMEPADGATDNAAKADTENDDEDDDDEDD